ncbi:centromere protein K-like [Ruditapes philippinarum]|uniref:centromere protein K-like n=1 Tax=Ruditapes philippinarum TaxID=129788 RepID=UPI00295AFFE5|nr:centromere protein K-like [Ruditapes philippinarum]
MNDLMREIALIEEENAALTRRVAAVRKSPEVLEVDLSDQPDNELGPSVDINILKEKCKQMNGQLHALKETALSTLPDNQDLQYITLKDDILKRNAQYRACAAFLNVQREEINEDIEKEEKTNEELKAVYAAAAMKLKETVHEKHNKSEVIRRLESKCSKLDRANSKGWKELSAFLDEHYPLPDQDAFNKVKKKIPVNECDDTQLLRLESLKPLKDIVDELIKACVDTPNSPYIVMDHKYWPPYVDLLLQVDIALSHPDDCMRIKLMPFHL